MSKYKSLTFHGRTEQVCEWVISKYANNKFYEDNISVQQWVQLSRDYLDDLAEDNKFDKALESKFGSSYTN